MFAVPRAARLACWLNAWLVRRASADDVISGLAARDEQVEFVGLSPGERLPAALLLGALRRHDVRRVSATLPVPGDLTGLGGPAAFNADALEAGEAAILHGPDLGLLPRVIDGTVSWSGTSASPPTYLPDVASADRELRAVLTQAANDLTELDVASWSPDVADALMNLRAPTQLDAPMTFPSPGAADLTSRALRIRQICVLAARDDGGTVSVREAEVRRAALVPLERSARTALVAACSSVDGH